MEKFFFISIFFTSRNRNVQVGDGIVLKVGPLTAFIFFSLYIFNPVNSTIFDAFTLMVCLAGASHG